MLEIFKEIISELYDLVNGHLYFDSSQFVHHKSLYKI